METTCAAYVGLIGRCGLSLVEPDIALYIQTKELCNCFAHSIVISTK